MNIFVISSLRSLIFLVLCLLIAAYTVGQVFLKTQNNHTKIKCLKKSAVFWLSGKVNPSYKKTILFSIYVVKFVRKIVQLSGFFFLCSYSNIFVTSPSPDNLHTLFEFIFKGFDALQYQVRGADLFYGTFKVFLFRRFYTSSGLLATYICCQPLLQCSARKGIVGELCFFLCF